MGGYSKDTHPLTHLFTKKYKVYLVEEGDDLRERVLTAKVREAKIEPEYYEPEEIYTGIGDIAIMPAGRLNGVTLTIDIERDSQGHYFTITDFTKEEE